MVPYCLTGGNAVTFDKTVLMTGGVNYNRFLSAIQREQQQQSATAEGNASLLDELKTEARQYLMQPVEWYQFNTDLLTWNWRTRQWTVAGCYPQLARAGAGVVFHEDKLFVICGELKPGIRTSECNYAIIQPTCNYQSNEY